jgi:hypothetical protein
VDFKNRTLKNSEVFKGLSCVVVPLGFEPRAAGLENLCSIQLSYGTIFWIFSISCNAQKQPFFSRFLRYAKVKKEIV